MLIRNAKISDGDGSLVDLRLDNGEIASIITTGSFTTEADQIDAEGRWVSPGLWDNHVHASQWALSARRLDVSTAESASRAGELVANALAAGAVVAAGQPFIGSGFRDGLWPDAPALEVLDAAGAGVPVVLISGDLHAAWLNSAALELYGHRGHETGLLREVEAFEVARRISSVPDDLLDSWLAEAGRAAAARGVVGIVDLEMDWNLDSWRRRMAAGFDSVRVEFGIYPQHLDRALELGLHTGQSIAPLLGVGRFKVITDGSLNTRTAYCYDEYPGLEGREGSRGLLTVPPAELLSRMRAASRAGLESSVHAIGDHATSLALDAFEQVGVGGRIEHAQLVADADLARFAALGVTASVQPDHAMDDRDVAERYWAGRTGQAFPLRSLLDAGATLAFGSDAPVSALDPWVTMAAAVGRSRGDREPWHPEQQISAREALAASTRGSVAVGQPADLILTDSDPSSLTAPQLRDVTVWATLMAGRLTHLARVE
ncbi:amidohydrolase family protein [Salinibacterium sp.]|uniref:amidohydrolase n=1 Tax=Salinibacterium sp. TaxID=1915057 RepID=UPI00286A47BA|nr:amidohydrolase family protein [Salinibacterium sp.]